MRRYTSTQLSTIGFTILDFRSAGGRQGRWNAGQGGRV